MKRRMYLIACLTSVATLIDSCGSPTASTTLTDSLLGRTAVSQGSLLPSLTDQNRYPIEAASTATTLFEPTAHSEQSAVDGISYFWPDYVPEDYVKLPQQSVVDDEGYRLSLIGPTWDVIRVVGGNPPELDGSQRDSERSVAEMCAVFACWATTIGGIDGQKSGGTGAGWAFMWTIGFHSYMVVASGSATPELEAVISGLTPVSREDWISHFENAQ